MIKEIISIVYFCFLGQCSPMILREHAPSGEKNGENTLGFLLQKARSEIGWSRKTLAYRSGISLNSINKYEKAGIDEDGQYPPANKLASLMFVLEMRPAEVFIACLPQDRQDEGRSIVSDDFNPSYEYMERQYVAILRDCQIYRTLFKSLFGPRPKPASREFEHLLWLIGAAKEIHDKQEDFEAFMLKNGLFVQNTRQYPHEAYSGKDELSGTYPTTRAINSVDTNSIAELLGWENPKGDGPDWDYIQEKMAVTFAREAENEESPEDDLPSPPSSDPTTPNMKTENDDGQPSD
jgi:transcriptional regulator with XRE-family HTH domain